MTGEEHSSVKVWTCVICDDKARYDDASTLLIHVQNSHSESITKEQTPAFLHASLLVLPDMHLSCPLCKVGEEQRTAPGVSLLDHIAEHVHSFALLALPWAPDEVSVEPSVIQEMIGKVSAWLGLDANAMPIMENLNPLLNGTTDEASVHFTSESYFGDLAYSGASSSSTLTETDRDLEGFDGAGLLTFQGDAQRLTHEEDQPDELEAQENTRDDKQGDIREENQADHRKAQAHPGVSPDIGLRKTGGEFEVSDGARPRRTRDEGRPRKQSVSPPSRQSATQAAQGGGGYKLYPDGVTKRIVKYKGKSSSLFTLGHTNSRY